jgi:hypothetical protein
MDLTKEPLLARFIAWYAAAIMSRGLVRPSKRLRP